MPKVNLAEVIWLFFIYKEDQTTLVSSAKEHELQQNHMEVEV